MAYSPPVDYAAKGLVKTTVLLDAELYAEIIRTHGKKKLSETINRLAKSAPRGANAFLELAGKYPEFGDVDWASLKAEEKAEEAAEDAKWERWYGTYGGKKK